MNFLMDVDYLLEHHASDDPIVVENILRAYYEPIFRFVMSILRDPIEADDAVQETFIQVALHLDRYRIGTNFRAWLYTIALNTCRGRLRKQGRWQRVLALFTDEPPPMHKPHPEELVLELEMHAQLKTALDALDEKHRLPVLLRFVHELPIAEIAQILGVREGTIHSRLHYALKRLRQDIAAEKWITPPGTHEPVVSNI